MTSESWTAKGSLNKNPAFPTKPYAALIFDCDGTLTDSMFVHFLAWKQTMDRHGIEITEDRFFSLGGIPTQKIIELLSREQGITVDSDAIAREKEDSFVKNINLLIPIVPVVEVARHFRGQIPMAVASGGCRDVIEKQLRHIGCGDWFDPIVTAEDTVRHKPDPDVFLRAAEIMKIPAQQCLVYEDAKPGLDAAKAAGMDAVDVRTFHTPRRIN